MNCNAPISLTKSEPQGQHEEERDQYCKGLYRWVLSIVAILVGNGVGISGLAVMRSAGKGLAKEERTEVESVPDIEVGGMTSLI